MQHKYKMDLRYLVLLVFFLMDNFLAFADDKAHPIKLIHINETVNAPVIDGNMDENEWDNETELSDFVLTNGDRSGRAAHGNTHCYLTYDKDFLYLAIITSNPVGGFKTSALNNDDPQIFYDDRIELFLDVNHDHRSYYNFVLNSDGNQLDQEIFQPLPKTRTHFPDLTWNAFWQVKTKSTNGKWITEVAIDLKSLGIGSIQQGTTIGFNIGVVKNSYAKSGRQAPRTIAADESAEYSAWSFVQDGIWETASNFNAPEMFGDLVFGDSKIQIKSISFPDASFQGPLGSPSLQGYNPIEITLENAVEDVDLLLYVTIPENKGKFQKENKEKITWSHQQTIKGDKIVKSNYYISNEKENRLVIKLLDNKSQQILYQTSYVLIVPPFLSYDLEALYKPVVNKPITFSKNFNNIPDEKNSLIIQFLNSDLQVLDSAFFKNFKSIGQSEEIFDINKIGSLKGGNYYIKSNIINDESSKILHTFIQPVTKFSLGNTESKLQAVEEEYTFGGLQGHAVTIKFPFGPKFVFWRLASYIPWWDIDQAAVSNEFVETWGGGLEGCAEPLQDRECRYSNVTILENTPARVKVKWRYALNDAHYKVYANEWIEEYYTFYPDGTGIREINLYANTNMEHEIFEAIYVNPPQVSTYQLFDKEVISIKNLQGESHSILQLQDDGALYKRFIQEKQNLILETHLKDRLNPFTVFAFADSSILPNVMANTISLAKELAPEGSRRGHWPASLYEVDGYNAVAGNAPGHFNLGNVHVMTDKAKIPNQWLFLLGIKEPQESVDIDFAKDWLKPPSLMGLSRNTPDGRYDKTQKGYIISIKEPVKESTFELNNGSVLNPVLIFQGNNLKKVRHIKVNGVILKNSNYVTSNYKNKVYIFLDLNLKAGNKLTISWK